MNPNSVIPVGVRRAVIRRDTNLFWFVPQEIHRLLDGVSRKPAPKQADRNQDRRLKPGGALQTTAALRHFQASKQEIVQCAPIRS